MINFATRKEEVCLNKGGENWRMLPREVVDAPSLETFQVSLDHAPDLAEDVPCHCREVGVDGL